MDTVVAQAIADRTVGAVFGYQNPYSLDDLFQKFAFDIRLPLEVTDKETGQNTWVQSTTPGKFITLTNANNKPKNYWFKPQRRFESIDDVLSAWTQINDAVSERQLDSVNVARSDNVYQSQNVYHSQDITGSENVLFCDGISAASNHIIACQRSKYLRNCIRVEDSKFCENSFNIIWSKNVKNCFFVSDASDVEDCIFSSHISKARYCVANVQLEPDEYQRVKDMVIRWVLTS